MESVGLFLLHNDSLKIPCCQANAIGNKILILDLRGVTQRIPPQYYFEKAKEKYVFDQVAFVESGQEKISVSWMNWDGSTAETCGNGLRCIAKYILEDSSDKIEISEGNIVHQAWLENDTVAVTMPSPEVMNFPMENLPDLGAMPTVISVGNPHLVYLFSGSEKEDGPNINEWGPILENHPMFPDRINVGIAYVLTPHTIYLNVWERGAGYTQACGSGACAAAFVAFYQAKAKDPITVHQQGGDLQISILSSGELLLKGTITLGEMEILHL